MPIPKNVGPNGQNSQSNDKNESASQNERIVNKYDPKDDTTFTSISIDDQIESELYDDETDDTGSIEKIDETEVDDDLTKMPLDKPSRKAKDDDEPSSKSEDDSEDSHEQTKGGFFSRFRRNKTKPSTSKDPEQNIEIDEKKKKLLPFGSSRKTLRVGDFDPRKDLRKKKMLVSTIALIILGAILSVSVYKAVFPEKSLTENEVAEIALSVTDYTNFPVDEGEGFATDFIKSYLSINAEDYSDKVMGYYYTGNMAASSSSTTNESAGRSASSAFNQNILYGPTVYKAEGLTDTSANYVIGALVEPKTDESKANDDDAKNPSETEPKWIFFNVNVYYDEANDSFAITPDSPTLVPAAEVKPQKDVPKAMPLGSGSSDHEIEEKIDSLVNGFIQGYATTSPTDYSAIEQYIVQNPDPELKKGLNSEFSLADSSSAVTYEAFPVEDSTEVKVRVTVIWTDKPNGAEEDSKAKVEYTSRYVMTLEQQSDGRYLVSKFAPEYYVADPTDK